MPLPPARLAKQLDQPMSTRVANTTVSPTLFPRARSDNESEHRKRATPLPLASIGFGMRLASTAGMGSRGKDNLFGPACCPVVRCGLL